MSNRMSVLSRRVRGFAFGFSFATFASFIIGMIANSGMITISNITGREAAFFFAGLGVLCFFAALLLWLAYGFAWAMIPERSMQERVVASEKFVEEKKPVQERVIVPEKPVEEKNLVQESKPVQEQKPVEENKFLVDMKPVVDKKLVWESQPVEEDKKLEWEEEKERSEEGAVYNIAGRRIN